MNVMDLKSMATIINLNVTAKSSIFAHESSNQVLERDERSDREK